MNNMEFLTVAYGEFQALYLEGDIYIHPDRIHQIGMDSAGSVDIYDRRFAMLLQCLPQLSLNEEEGILLLQLIGKSNTGSHHFQLPMSRVKCVSALSEKAQKLLAQRLESFGMDVAKLSSDGPFQHVLDSRKSELSVRGGEELVQLLFKQPDDAMLRVLSRVFRETPNNGIGQSEVDDAQWSGWLAEACRYVRSDPYEKGDVEFIADARKALEKAAKTHGRPFNYEPISKDLSDNTRTLMRQKPSLEKLLSNPDVCNAIGRFELEFKQEAQLEHAFTALTVFFFLKRTCFEKQRRELNFDLLLKGVGKLANSDHFSAVQTSVWLLGSHLGFDSIAKYVYAADADRFSWFVGERPSFNKISLPSVSKISTSVESIAPAELGTSSDLPSPEKSPSNLSEKEAKARINSTESNESTDNLSTTDDTETKPVPSGEVKAIPEKSLNEEANEDAENLKDEPGGSATQQAPKQTESLDTETVQKKSTKDDTKTAAEPSTDKQKKSTIKKGRTSPAKMKTVVKKGAPNKSKSDESDGPPDGLLL